MKLRAWSKEILRREVLNIAAISRCLTMGIQATVLRPSSFGLLHPKQYFHITESLDTQTPTQVPRVPGPSSKRHHQLPLLAQRIDVKCL